MTKEELYLEFLNSKIEIAKESGFDILDSEITECLYPHDKVAVKWAIKGGRRALFENFGLHKTVQQLEICRIITHKKQGKGLIVCPLGVKQEFLRDAKKLLNINIKYIRTNEEFQQLYNECDIFITNYERVRDGNINPKDFIVTSLDEASVLRSYGSKTYQTFLDKFHGVQYKFVCTATPSPNKYKELIHYGGYLEVMDTGQALTRFFQRDSTQANNLTLYPHKEKEFWFWLSTWALFITKPSDLGFSDEGYDLPKLNIHYHCVDVDHSSAGSDKRGEFKMFRDSALGLEDASKEKRESISARVDKMVEIIKDDPESNYILWHDLEAERHAIRKALPTSKDVFGSQDYETREQRIIDFSEGNIQYFATKPRISGQGCNFQYHCNKAIFLGIGYKFNDFIQAIHRIYRFQQNKEVEIHIIYAESEQEILKTLKTKWSQHDKLVTEMIKIIKENGLSGDTIENKLQRTIGVKRKIEESSLYTAVYNDCTLETMRMDENSVDLIHTSIPFSNHYEYTPSYNDYGHNKDNDKFFEQMDFLTPELLRILKPGRVAAIYVKDRILFGNATGKGMPTLDPFHADCIFHYVKHGFAFFGMITVVTDVVRENNQTYRLGWTEQTKDGTKMGVGCPEYVLLFRKLPTDTSKAYADDPVTKTKEEYTRAQWQIDAHSFWRSSGDRFLSSSELDQTPMDKIQKYYTQYSKENIYSYDDHVQIAKDLDKKKKLPSTFMVVAPASNSDYVWDDVIRMHTLNSKQTQKKQQNHICPLQFDIVERIINRYSNPGDLVLDPFGGLMTVPYKAVEAGRKGYGIELNPEYFLDGLRYLKEIDHKMISPKLFDLLKETEN